MNMKVAFVVGRFPCLSETFVLNQITALINSGHDVTILAVENPGEEKVHSDVDQFDLMQKTIYFPLIPVNKFLRIIKGLGLIFRGLFTNPFRLITCLNVVKFGKDALSLKLLYYNIPVLDRKFDILHCHFGQNGLIGSCLKRAGAGCLLLTTFHGYDLSEYLTGAGPGIFNELFQVCDLCLPISEHWKYQLIEMGCPEERIAVHHMGIDVDRLQFQKRQLSPDEPVKILTIGRLVEKKGHEYAIRAIARSLSEHSNLEYTIAGSGPLEASLKKLVKDLRIESCIRFRGECNRAEVQELFAECHIFVLSSITSSKGDKEGIPVVLMEAQAVGMPVVSTLHSGIPEGVLDGKSGFLVPEKDIESLYEKIGYLIAHPEKWPELGRQGRSWVEKQFNQPVLDMELESIFEKLLKGKRCQS